MLNHATMEKLKDMHLGTMAAAFEQQGLQAEMAGLSFEDRFGMLVDAEWTKRKNNQLRRLISQAGYSIPTASLEDVEYHADRQLDKTLITKLGTCGYIHEHHNIIILGATGSGKSFLANAFGMAANRQYLPVCYMRLPDLLGELALARGEGTYHKVIRNYKRVRLLILDEWLLHPIKDVDASELLEIIEARYQRASTIFCSQFDIGGWHQKIGEVALADAICDRIVHDSYKITIGSAESMRKRKGINPEA